MAVPIFYNVFVFEQNTMELLRDSMFHTDGYGTLQIKRPEKNVCPGPIFEGEQTTRRKQMDIKKILSLIGCLAELYKIVSEDDI